MIDRTTPVFLLRPKVLLGAAGVSGAVFSSLLLAALVCVVTGAIGWALCWLVFLVAWVLGYGLVVAAALIPFGAVGAAAKDGENAGCAGLIAIAIGLGILGKGLPWMSANLAGPQEALVGKDSVPGWDDGILSSCTAAASYLVNDLFLKYQVYLYSWSALAAILAGALICLFALAALRTERPFKTVFRRIRNRCKLCGGTNVRFRCPGAGCTVWHDDLRPTVYGVFRATCARCQTKLPTTDLFGRLNLTQSCANLKCSGAADAGAGGISEYHFAVVGAQSSGKSCFLFATVWKFLDFAAANGWTIAFPDPRQKMEFDEYVRSFQAGRAIPKTISRERPLAFTLDVTSISGASSRLYLYDAAGEDFEAGDVSSTSHGMGSFDFFSYADGIFFVIDPMSEEEAGAKRAENNHARHESSFMLSRLLPVLERAQKTTAGRQIPVPIAVVVTKAEVALRRNETTPLLGKMTGPDLVRRCESIERAGTDAVADSHTVRDFVAQVGAADVVQLMEASFINVQYFAVSALGREAQSAGPFNPVRVLQPLVWLGIRSGALTDDMVASRAWRNAADYFTRARRGQEGGLLQVSVWAIMLTLVASCGGGCWYLGGPVWAGVGTVAAVVLPLLIARVSTHGLADVGRARGGVGEFLGWFGTSLRGRNGRKSQLLALGLASLAVALAVATVMAWLK